MRLDETPSGGPLFPSPDLYARLATASWEEPKPFAETLLRILATELDLTAASLWLYTRDDQPLRLRAEVGLDATGYESFELELTHYPGQSVQQRRVLAVSAAELEASPFYRDKGIVPREAAGMVTGPLTVPDDAPRDRDHVGVSGAIGALCLYPRDASALTPLKVWLEEHGGFLARLYLATLERYSIGLRRTIVERVAFRKDIGSLEHNFLLLALTEMSVDAAQLWVMDVRQGVLLLHRTAGLSGVQVHDVLPLQEGDEGAIFRCFSERTTLVHSKAHPLAGSDGLARGLPQPLLNATLIPLEMSEKARLRGESVPTAGVLVLINHRATVGETSHPATATWEDCFIARFSSEMLAVLIYRMLRSRDYAGDFERLMHASDTNLQSSLNHLLALEENHVDMLVDESQRNFISDSIFWLEDLSAQINRNKLIGDGVLDVEAVHLNHQVLSKLTGMARRMTPRPPARKAAVHGLEPTPQLRMLPKVKGDAIGLICVFRNLVDNCVKYAPRTAGFVPEVWFDVSLSDDLSQVSVVVSDNGIGIPAIDRDHIFQDGYRGSRARSHVPDGVGRGLHDCRTLLRRMGGDIELLPTPPDVQGARFEVTLQVFDESKERAT